MVSISIADLKGESFERESLSIVAHSVVSKDVISARGLQTKGLGECGAPAFESQCFAVYSVEV